MSQQLHEPEEREFSWLEFHRALKRAGLTRERAALQSGIGHLVERVAASVIEISGESYYDWMMTGSFVEGWGNNLFRLDAVTGIDSDIDWSQVVKHKVYHLGKTCHSIVDCINRKDYELVNGHIDVKNSSQQPAFDTPRHGLRPDTDECHAYPCCSYPDTVLDKDMGKLEGEIKCEFEGKIQNAEIIAEVNGEFKGKIVGEVGGNFQVNGTVKGRVGDQEVDGRVDRNIEGQIDCEIDGDLSGQLKASSLSGEFHGEMDGQFKGELAGELKGELKAKICGEICGEIIGGEVDCQVSGEVNGEAVNCRVSWKSADQGRCRIEGEVDGTVSGKVYFDVSERANGKISEKEVHKKFLEILKEQFNNVRPVEDVHFVRASVPGRVNQLRLSCTRQERFIMSQLSTVQGQLFTMLKYLFKSNKDDRDEKIIESVKSYHAKTLLMTLLRNEDSWPRSESDSDEVAADQLHRLFYSALNFMLESIERNCPPDNSESEDTSTQQQPNAGAASGTAAAAPSRQTSTSSTASTSSQPAADKEVPHVLEHALLKDSKLYLKPSKKKDAASAGKAGGFFSIFHWGAGSGKKEKKPSERDAHVYSLRQMKQDLERLIDHTKESSYLIEILKKYQERIEATSEHREKLLIPPEEATGPEAKFLFIPLAMLPRITLDTLLEERRRRQRQESQKAAQSEAPVLGPAQASGSGRTQASEHASEPESAASPSQQPLQPALQPEEMLKEAYIRVWIVLRSLTDSSETASAGDTDRELQEAKAWIKDQKCLRTAWRCLQIMEKLKSNKGEREMTRKDEIVTLLEEFMSESSNNGFSPTRWIKPADCRDFSKLLSEEDCVWMFHYFIQPKTKMSFNYLDDIQKFWQGEDVDTVVETVKGKQIKYEYIKENDLRKDWMNHLVVKDMRDDKNSRQPSLTVNFDGLMDSFLRWTALCLGKKCSSNDYGFLPHLRNALFDPREAEKLRGRKSDK